MIGFGEIQDCACVAPPHMTFFPPKLKTSPHFQHIKKRVSELIWSMDADIRINIVNIKWIILKKINIQFLVHFCYSSPCPIGWGCRIHQLLLCREVRPPPPMSVLIMILNNLMMRFQHCLFSQVHSGLER